MAEVLAVANTKGGVGKSTLTINFAVEAVKKGKRVLVVDADPQGSSITALSVRDDDRPEIQGVEMTKPILHKQIPQISEPFDLVLIDVGGRDAPVFRSALVAADKILVPMVPSAFDTWASTDVFNVIDELMVSKEGLRTWIVLNQVTRTVAAKESRQLLNELVEEHNVSLLETSLAARTAWKRSIGEGLGVSEWSRKGPAVDELRALCEEIGL